MGLILSLTDSKLTFCLEDVDFTSFREQGIIGEKGFFD